MERLKTQNLHFKRVLDRQLSDLETKHRHSELKRLREVRSLGLDLAKLQQSTRDVDEIMANSMTTSTSIENTPRTSTPRARRASFAGFGPSGNSSRPLTSPNLPATPGTGRRSSVTSSVAHLLSRSRQELTTFSLTSPSPSPIPRTPRRHSVYDFRQQQQQQHQLQHRQKQSSVTRKSSLPELKRSNSIDNTVNNNNNNTSNNNNNNNNSSNNNYSFGIINNGNVNIEDNIDNNEDPIQYRIDNVNNNKTRRPAAAIQRRHSSADLPRSVSVTIRVLNQNNNNNNNNNNNDNNNSARTISKINTKANNSSSNNITKNNTTNNNNNNNNNNNHKRTMTVGTERRSSNAAITKDNKVVQSTRRTIAGNLTTTNSQSNTMQDINNTPPMSGKSPTRLQVRRGSSDSTGSGSSPTLKKRLQRLSLTPAEEVSHNETVNLVHRDDEEPEVKATDGNAPGSGSMFSRQPKRRASEPAVGGQFLRDLQNKMKDMEKEEKTNGNGGASSIPLRQAIEEELPSGIVAEEDEDRYNKEEAEEELKKKNRAQTPTKPSADMSLTSSSTSSMSSSKASSSKKSQKDNSSSSSKKSESGESSGKTRNQSRRKSEGDALRFARIWRFHAGNKESLKGLLEDMDQKESAVKTPPETKDDIWDAVRNCRYIRGNDPSDNVLSESTDLGEYVFGHQNAQSTFTTK